MEKTMWAGVCAVLALFAFNARAFDLPKGLTSADRSSVIRTLGLNTATKMLTNPYPLGGYSGFEVGVSYEIIDIEDIQNIGCVGTPGCNTSAISDNTWSYTRITIGKGIYHDLDVFFHFIPPIGNVGVSDYGGAIRYSFYQAQFLPINISVLGHIDQLNFRDEFTNRNIGLELMAGLNLDYFEVYFGSGWVQAAGVFNGDYVANDGSVDPNEGTVKENMDALHTVVGISAHYDEFFAAAQVDRFQDVVYSLKVGLRF